MTEGQARAIAAMTKANLKHGRSGTRTYEIWCKMRARCNNPENDKYKYYGAKGITICSRWSCFENFLEDMGEAPEKLSIHRRNNDKGYRKSNCEWADQTTQSRVRSYVKLTMKLAQEIRKRWSDGERQKDLAAIFKVSQPTISAVTTGITWIP